MRRAAAALLAAALLITPAATAQLATRPATFVWNKTLLQGTFSFRDAIDDKVKKRLKNGLVVTIVMRGYVYKNGSTTPVALTANTCKIAYDLWNEVFAVVVNGVTKKAVVNMNGVYRLCTDMDKLPIVERKALSGPSNNYYLAVHVEVGDIRLRCQLRDNTCERKFVFTPWRFDPLERSVLAASHLFTPLGLALPWLVGALADAAGTTAALAVLAIQPLGLLLLVGGSSRFHPRHD